MTDVVTEISVANAPMTAETDLLTFHAALHSAVQSRLLTLIESNPERVKAWEDTKDVIAWDSEMDGGNRMARLHLLVTLMAVYSGRPSIRDEAFDEFLRALTGGGPEEGGTAGARAFNRASDWLARMTKEGVIKEGEKKAAEERKYLRGKIDAAVQGRLRALLDARNGDLAQHLDKEAALQGPGMGRYWLKSVAFNIFLTSRRPSTIAEAETEINEIARGAQAKTDGGRAYVRCHALLKQLVLKGLYLRDEILQDSPYR